MRKASFKVVNANSNSSLHNSRENAPKYLIEDIGYDENYYDLKYSDVDYLALSELKYLHNHKQKMQQRQKVALIKETVLNLENHHTVNDVENLFDTLNQKYGGHKITELSIHRDEGHFVKDGIPYYPTKHILKKDDDWYIVPIDKFLDDSFKPTKKDFNEKVNIEDFTKVKNYHAHVKFSMFDLETGLTGRMTKGQVSKRLEVVANELNLAYKPNEKISSGKAINHIKDEHDLNRRSSIKELFLNKEINKQKDKKKEYKYNFREQQKEITSLTELTTKQKKELHKLNSGVKNSKANEKSEKLLELTNKISKYEEAFKTISPGSKNTTQVKSYVSNLEKSNTNLTLKNQTLKNDFKSLQAQNRVLEDKITSLEVKMASSATMEDLEADFNKKLNEQIKINKIQIEQLATLTYANTQLKSQLTSFTKQKSEAITNGVDVKKDNFKSLEKEKIKYLEDNPDIDINLELSRRFEIPKNEISQD